MTAEEMEKLRDDLMKILSVSMSAEAGDESHEILVTFNGVDLALAIEPL
jgi:hypothetical protein